MKHILILTLLLNLQFSSVISSDSIANKHPLIPNGVHLQYAGNIGLGGVGVDYISNNHKHVYGLGLGYLPKSIHGAEVKTVFLKYQYKFSQLKIYNTSTVDFYTGSNLMYAKVHNTYLMYPNYFPRSYYDITNAIHFTPFLGINLGNFLDVLETSKALGVYWELGTVDYKLWHAIASKAIYLYEIWNIALGVSFCF